MITVIHFNTGKDPEIHFGISDQMENKILKAHSQNWKLSRSSPEDWPGQENPGYVVHHWDAVKKRS